MVVANQADVLNHTSDYFDIAVKGDPVMVSGKENHDIVILSRSRYEEMTRAEYNAKYSAVLDKGFTDIRAGRYKAKKSLEELRSMES